jgi:anti-sigma factor RsiW
MNECARFGPGIAEVALGSQPREALSEHLAQCDACAAEVARQRALVERFELTLGVLAQPEPPEGLVQNVLRQVRASGRARIHERPRAQPRPTASRGRRLAAAFAGLAIAASLILFLVRFQSQRSGNAPAQTAALTTWRSPTLSLLENHGSVLRSQLGTSRFSLERRSLHS